MTNFEWSGLYITHSPKEGLLCRAPQLKPLSDCYKTVNRCYSCCCAAFDGSVLHNSLKKLKNVSVADDLQFFDLGAGENPKVLVTSAPF
ncbi:hypothetical protein [uncultured Amphritea sp.]|uniref:hypothetical protein n=1 Tax=Amphritea sp. TaxID=1872502 RepID=UPI0025D01B59|nr:hypothetical protein [uncultured Amphritea sp.]